MTRAGRVVRRAALPLAAYYAVTLVLPLANGAARADTFAEHALVVLAVPPIIVLLVWTALRFAAAIEAVVQLRTAHRKRAKANSR